MDQFIDFLFEQWPLTLAFIFIVILIGRSFLEPILTGVKDIKPQDAVRLINDDDTLLLDVRVDKEFKEGHILGTTHIPLGALESRIKEIDDHKGDKVVIYCQTGMRSKQAGGILKKHGFETMFSIQGGLNAWINANLPVNKSTKPKKKK